MKYSRITRRQAGRQARTHTRTHEHLHTHTNQTCCKTATCIRLLRFDQNSAIQFCVRSQFPYLRLILTFCRFSLRRKSPSWCSGLPRFVGHSGWGGSSGDAYMSQGRRRLSDVCGYPVSRTASVDVCSEGDVLRLPSFAHHLFSPNFWGLATLTKLKQKCASVPLNLVLLRIYRTELSCNHKNQTMV